jgi:hypothetical protein
MTGIPGPGLSIGFIPVTPTVILVLFIGLYQLVMFQHIDKIVEVFFHGSLIDVVCGTQLFDRLFGRNTLLKQLYDLSPDRIDRKRFTGDRIQAKSVFAYG